ncbi:uncharacterized mitochondrial protein AtMg00810-like [Humulus lupulus]|uniref:uncharacterized mitochondrial protein AtMg00810-like n=1 Tax=Humulus lupulus TaxID=3486 RepID=UPI002B414550|nr:uncharacterized mitochondrial protein AtMg00810-like [Humulus lupulus]
MNGYRRGIVDKTLFVKNVHSDIAIAQIYVDDIEMSMFGLEFAKQAKTPIGTTAKLTNDENGVRVNPTLYRSMIGSFLYLTASRPDISYGVGVCAHDADWAGSANDRKITSAGCFYLGNNSVSWHNKKQNSTSLSTVEAEYIAAESCYTQLLWMK